VSPASTAPFPAHNAATRRVCCRVSGPECVTTIPRHGFCQRPDVSRQRSAAGERWSSTDLVSSTPSCQAKRSSSVIGDAHCAVMTTPWGIGGVRGAPNRLPVENASVIHTARRRRLRPGAQSAICSCFLSPGRQKTGTNPRSPVCAPEAAPRTTHPAGTPPSKEPPSPHVEPRLTFTMSQKHHWPLLLALLAR